VIVGHIGVAGALARVRPRVSLWWLLPAAIAPDLLDIGYALAGVCNPYGLYSHTLPAAVLLGAAIAAAAFLAGRRETAVLVCLVVLLHLPLDYVTGRKLYWPGGEMYGLMLYDRPLLDFLVESTIAVAGWALLRGNPRTPRWARGAWSLALVIVVQAAFNAADDLASKPNACATVSPEGP
jgi:hypothetical protein